ncbi:MAG: helix-turn-helix transcriptional regulator [Clostridia bacterium]|nr:helix-turn-helix transcriptional regulator [Clostridia bacterium]
MKNRIRQLREEKNMTQVRLSIELEVSQETISSYESGKHYPSVSNLIKLSHLFHASCDYILGLSNIRHPYIKEDLKTDELLILEKYNILETQKKALLHAYLEGLLS